MIVPATLPLAPITNESFADPPVRLSTFWKATLPETVPEFDPDTV